MSGLFEQIDSIFATAVPVGTIRKLSGLKGGVERWMQVQMMLKIIDKEPSFWGTSSGFVAQRDIRQEAYYSGGGRCDLLVKNMPGVTNQSWCAVELKHGASTSTTADSVAEDVCRLWTRPTMADPEVTVYYGVFLFVPANIDEEDQCRSMLDRATDALFGIGASKTLVQQRLFFAKQPFPHLQMKIGY